MLWWRFHLCHICSCTEFLTTSHRACAKTDEYHLRFNSISVSKSKNICEEQCIQSRLVIPVTKVLTRYKDLLIICPQWQKKNCTIIVKLSRKIEPVLGNDKILFYFFTCRGSQYFFLYILLSSVWTISQHFLWDFHDQRHCRTSDYIWGGWCSDREWP